MLECLYQLEMLTVKILTKIKQEELPKGKRTIRTSIYGNVNAYVGGKFWKTLGNARHVSTEEIKNWIEKGE